MWRMASGFWVRSSSQTSRRARSARPTSRSSPSGAWRRCQMARSWSAREARSSPSTRATSNPSRRASTKTSSVSRRSVSSRRGRSATAASPTASISAAGIRSGADRRTRCAPSPRPHPRTPWRSATRARSSRKRAAGRPRRAASTSRCATSSSIPACGSSVTRARSSPRAACRRRRSSASISVRPATSSLSSRAPATSGSLAVVGPAAVCGGCGTAPSRSTSGAVNFGRVQLPPLAGLKVLEVGNYMAGPFCGMQLADLGADVVKVEDPRGGDLSRRLEPMVDGESGNFVRLNRSKRSIALDLKRDAAKEVFRRLAAPADVIVENLRPGTMQDLGLAPRELLDANPRLVYAAVTGWGLDGPYADRPALDIIVQAQSGLMSVTGEASGAPVKVGVSISDLTAGLYATIAIMGALAVRERDGRGQMVDISMFESSVSLAVWEAGTFFTTGEVPRAAGAAPQLVAPYQAIRAADGHFVLGATTPPTWTAFCRALGLARLEHDPRFADGTKRRLHLDELIPLIEKVTMTRPAAPCLEVLRAPG